MDQPKKTQFKKEFSTQKPDEKIILILRKHWFILAWPFFKGVVLILLILFMPLFGKLGFYIFNSAFLTFVYLAWMIFWGNYIVYEYLNWYRDRFIITTQRVVNIDQKSMFRRRVSEIELDHIQDISHEINGVSATSFKFGNVILSSTGDDNIELRDIPQPAEVQDLLVKLVKDAMRGGAVTAEELVDFIKQQRR
ncbi:PH domain-containing protein [Patescibacteria group bacterium]|nr:PH domain-containing protein [Patescibacteria group bacterium]